jgi:hypothetical protein
MVRWPLHSPGRLASVVAVMVALVWLFAAVRPGAVAEQASSTSAVTSSPMVTSSATTAATSTPAPVSTTMTSSDAEIAGSPAEVAGRFVGAWARPDLPVEAWQADLLPLATPEFGAQLRTVDPSNVPARSVTGAAAGGSLTALSATVTVPTDAGLIVVELAVMGEAWLVSGLSPAGPPPSRTDAAGSSLAATYTPLPAAR